MKTLAQLYEEHHGKVSDKWSLYLSVYDRLLSPYRDQAVNFLEIGIQNGGSLELWAQFFQSARNLIGCDINPACAHLEYTDSRIDVVIGDANLEKTEGLIASRAERFDVVIDDGSHTSRDIVKTFVRYFPRLNEGGIFIVEDLHCSYWSEYEGGLHFPYSSIAFFKHLIDAVNHEHWGIDKQAAGLLKGFKERYSFSLSDDVLQTIHSIEFFNSICVIRKAKVRENVLGHRAVVGEIASVVDEVAALREQQGTVATLPQQGNVWSTLERPPAELWQQAIGKDLDQIKEMEQLRAQVELQASKLAELRQGLISCEERIASDQREVAFQQGQLAELRLLAGRYQQRCLKLQEEATRYSAQLTSFQSAKEKLEIRFEQTQREASIRDEHIKALRHDVLALTTSTSWRITFPLRWAKSTALKVFRSNGGPQREANTEIHKESHPPVIGGVDVMPRPGYAEWIQRYDQIDDATREAIRKRIAALDNAPLISIVMPVYNPHIEWLADAIDSVQRQIYTNWQLCIADDKSPNPEVRSVLERYAKSDKRIKLIFRERNGHISAASNSALEMATGEWVALLDHDDLLPEHALYCVALEILAHPSAQMIYSDEDKISDEGTRYDPYFKCDWNPDMFYSHNMFCHLGVYRKALIDKVGGFRIGLEGAQDYDLALRCIEQVDTSAIRHIPRILYHWRVHAESTASTVDAKPYAIKAGEQALNEHFTRQGIKGTVEWSGRVYRARYKLPQNPPLVSLIIPTRNALHLIRQCVDSIFEKTEYPNYEIIIVDNGSDDPEAIAYFNSISNDERIQVLRDERPFNYSALNNGAVSISRGELIGLVNNDIEVISSEWLTEMVGLALQPGIGAVGAKLLYPNDTLQHGGVVLGIGGVAGHANKHAPQPCYGYFGRTSLISGYSAVTGACLLIRRSIYEEVNGLNEIDLTVAFNDVDFCLRVREAGYRNVWTPYAELYHHESATRGFEDNPVKQARFSSEVDYMRRRWGNSLFEDPAYSRNLTLEHEDFSLAWPPRVGALV